MSRRTRRSVLARAGLATASAGLLAGCTFADDEPSTAPDDRQLELVGHALLDDEPSFYTQGTIRDDGEYGLLGSYHDEAGTVLVDLEELAAPTMAHRLPSDADNRQNDVKFDPSTDVYYRSQEENVRGGAQGFQVVDYGHDDGTPAAPELLATVETPRTGVHNLRPHPTEPILYAVDKADDEPGILAYDVSDPANPTLEAAFGPDGFCHDCEVEVDRDLLHAAYIQGAFVGYAVLDVSDPLEPVELARVDYDERADYATVGEPGFERCHQASFDPERGLAIVGDETHLGTPGGKHVFDIGWDEGSPAEPIHVGFTHSPNAREMDDHEPFFWTTHFHTVVPRGDRTLLVDGGYHEGAWVADVTDPRDPQPAQQFPTLEGDDRAADLWADHEDADLQGLDVADIHAPFAWSAEYNAERDVVFVSDSVTGAYVFDLAATSFEPWSIEAELRRSYAPRDELGERGLELARHYHEAHASVPNTGGESITRGTLRELDRIAEES